ncbi:MAG: hypothetical protein CVU39_06420 [Chloroflexi bacterium HGW-Chloroflexi-10]|nr:MAG: hypothetical protein CVU39_06420 [Chloroflexi bacterium HGW-Chloroflexi-10]
MKRIKNILTETWNLIKNHPILSILIFLVIAGLLMIAYLRFVLGWVPILDSGFIKYSVTKIIETDPLTQKTIETEIHTRTWWDWLELLIIPVVLAGGALFLNKSERDNDRKIAQKRFENEQSLALDRQCEEAIQSYFNRMNDLLLEKNLLKSKNEDEIRAVARTLTISTMFSLDTRRNCLLLHFLSEAKLIGQKDPIIKFEKNDLNKLSWSEGNLRGLNLSNFDFRAANFSMANLRGVDLSNSDLSEANLTQADLGIADLICSNLSNSILRSAFMVEVNLSNANLEGADLTGAILSDSELIETHLKDCDMSCVDFENAIVSIEQLAQTRSLEGATLPDGTTFHGDPKDLLKKYPPQTPPPSSEPDPNHASVLKTYSAPNTDKPEER